MSVKLNKQVILAVEAPTRPIDTAADSEGGKQTPSYVSLSDKYAIVDAAGTQMLLEEGRWYTCNRLQVPDATFSLGHHAALYFCCCFSVLTARGFDRQSQVAQSSSVESWQQRRMAPSQVVGHT